MAGNVCKGSADAQKHPHATPQCVPRRPSRAGCAGQLFLALAITLFANAAGGQNAPEPPAPDETANPNPPAEALQPIPTGEMSVHGVVKNALTGDPLPRALVQVDGETGPGVLTDRDGKFDLMAPGSGSHVIQLTKPGFHDLPPDPSQAGTVLENSNGITHNVFVTDGLPDLSFAMTPTSVIQGHIDLSTGDTAQGIGVQLLRRTLQGGHAAWLIAAMARTNNDGAFRFAGLDDGDYAIATEPARESEVGGIPFVADSSGTMAWNGFAATFYPDARDFASAARIHLHGGETEQANMTLKLEAFQPVRAALGPARSAEKPAAEYGAAVLDTQGHSLPYSAQYDPETRTVQAMLPDGAYALQVTATPRPQMKVAAIRNPSAGGTMLQGILEISVAGHPIAGVRMALAERVANPVAVNVTRNAAHPGSPPASGGGVSISVTQAGDTRVDGAWSQFAQGNVPGELDTSVLAPGSYWVHTSINQPGLCEESFTAAGASLAREPLVVAAGGTSAPMSLALRDDCASLKLNLPPGLGTPTAGEEPAFTVYVVPDFDSTVDIAALTLRASSGGTLTVPNLTPGSYHVYTFTAPVELEYRNPEALAKLPNFGQSVTLEPLATSTLTVEGPPR